MEDCQFGGRGFIWSWSSYSKKKVISGAVSTKVGEEGKNLEDGQWENNECLQEIQPLFPSPTKMHCQVNAMQRITSEIK